MRREARLPAHARHRFPGLNTHYSADGRRIAFVSNRSGDMAIWTFDAAGSNCVKLTSFGDAPIGSPRWSPDGQWIAFDSNAAGQSEIYVVQSDGGAARRMTNHPAADITPAWSRDGRWLYFGSDRSGRMETWKMPPEGGAPVQVTQAGGGYTLESPDGEFLYYCKFDRRNPIETSIFRRALQGARRSGSSPGCRTGLPGT